MNLLADAGIKPCAGLAFDVKGAVEFTQSTGTTTKGHRTVLTVTVNTDLLRWHLAMGGVPAGEDDGNDGEAGRAPSETPTDDSTGPASDRSRSPRGPQAFSGGGAPTDTKHCETFPTEGRSPGRSGGPTVLDVSAGLDVPEGLAASPEDALFVVDDPGRTLLEQVPGPRREQVCQFAVQCITNQDPDEDGVGQRMYGFPGCRAVDRPIATPCRACPPLLHHDKIDVDCPHVVEANVVPVNPEPPVSISLSALLQPPSFSCDVQYLRFMEPDLVGRVGQMFQPWENFDLVLELPWTCMHVNTRAALAICSDGRDLSVPRCLHIYTDGSAKQGRPDGRSLLRNRMLTNRRLPVSVHLEDTSVLTGDMRSLLALRLKSLRTRRRQPSSGLLLGFVGTGKFSKFTLRLFTLTALPLVSLLVVNGDVLEHWQRK